MATGYQKKKESLAAQLRAAQGPVALQKDTSNLFRDRAAAPRRRLDVRAFNEVLHVDKENNFVESEGMVTYEALVDACLPHGVMPAVTPIGSFVTTIRMPSAGGGITSP